MNGSFLELPISQETALIWTRLPTDANAITHTLENAGIQTSICDNAADFCAALPWCLMAILTMEVLSPSYLTLLEAALSRQPVWSDVPVILLTDRAVPPAVVRRVADLSNVTMLERPLRPASLLSVVHSARRARRRQFEVADLLQQNASLNEKLRRSMTETHHRVKNNLQLISALVELMAMDADEIISREELMELGARIVVLASIHDILTEDTKNEGDGTSLSVKTVLEKLLSLLGQTLSGRRLHPFIENIRLSTRHCTSLAVITNELVSNALKYSDRDIDVRFTVSASEAVLRVQDDGPGFPPGFDPVRHGHTGMDLVLNLSEHDLNATIHFGNAVPRGGCVTVRFPLPAETELPLLSVSAIERQ